MRRTKNIMKQIVKLLTLMCHKAHLPAVVLMALLSGLAAHADVVIDETTFPDANFRNYILSQTYGKDGVLTDAEIAEVKSIPELNPIENIGSLKGIEYFTALEYLQVHVNNLTEIDLSKNTMLKRLSCAHNQLTALDVSKNIALESLSCGANQLNSLDLSKNSALKSLSCNNNHLSALDVSNNIELEELLCPDNQLTTLDVRNNPALKMLLCANNHLTELDLRNNSLLSRVHYVNQTRNLTAESAVTPDGERYYYLRLDENTDGDKSIVERMTETNFGSVESKFDPLKAFAWSGGTVIEGQKRVATTAEAVDPNNVKGKILLLTDVTENTTTNTASGTVTYLYSIGKSGNGDFTLNWTAPIPMNPITAVTDLRDSREAVGVTYTNLAGQVSDKPFTGVNIVVTRYDDGSTRTDKVIR